MIEITIPGSYSQKRHRTNGFRRYDPSAKDKKVIRQHLLPIKPPEPLEGKFELTIISYIQTPTSWSEKKRKEYENEFRAKTPDTDNIDKIIFDSMNDYILKDDKQIVRSITEKRYSKTPATYIKLRPLSS